MRKSTNRTASLCAGASFELTALEGRRLCSAAPAAPSDLLAVPAVSSTPAIAATATSDPMIQLNWRDNSADEAGFMIFRSGDGGAFYSIAGTVAANVTSFQDTGRTPGWTYSYYVKSFNGADYSYASNLATVTLPQEPLAAAPSNLTITSLKGKKAGLVLNWQDNSDNERWFYVQISTDGANWTTL